MDMIGWLEYFSEGLAVQLGEIKIRVKSRYAFALDLEFFGKWWRRRELNPRPQILNLIVLHV